MQRTAFKPVSHQASIVISGRLTDRPPGCDPDRKMRQKCNMNSMPHMLAFVETAAASNAVYPEPEYLVNVANCHIQKPGSGDRIDQYTFLGIVQTPGKSNGVGYNAHGAGVNNAIHSGGTMTTFNTGPDTIASNDIVMFMFPEDAKIQGLDTSKSNLPYEWHSFYEEGARFALTVKYDNNPLKEHRIIGRAISSSSPGQQLDLIMKS